MTENKSIPHEEYMKSLECDCCGKEIISSRFPVCVMNPYEVLCMECFRADHRENAMVIKENANNYRLQSDLKNKREDYNYLLNRFNNVFDKYKECNELLKKNNERNQKLIDKAYECAIATDSASAIEIIRNLKKELEE